MTTTQTATIQTVREIHSPIEDALVIDRENGEKINFTAQHFGTVHQFSIATVDPETEEVSREIEFSYAEAAQLRALLNDPRVVALLDQE